MKASLTHLGLGTAQFGTVYGLSNQGKMVSDTDLDYILSILKEQKIQTLDTAAAYGHAEERLGYRDLSSFNVVTKIIVPETNHGLKQFVPERSIEQSLIRLRISRLDAVLIHNADKIALDTLINILSKIQVLVESGICRKVGVSLYNPYKLEYLLGRTELGLAQIPFNVFDQRLMEEKLQTLIKKNKLEIHVRSIFLQGLLLLEKTAIPNYFKPWQNYLELWRKYLKARGITELDAVMSFVNKYKKKYISRFIFGVETPQQLSMIIKSSKIPPIGEIKHLRCDDLNLIDPSRWKLL